MIRNSSAPRTNRLAWLVLIALLLALRLPSLVQPAGSDQGIYGYSAERLLHGGVLYRDSWDQKPPGIATIYALAIAVWPHESVVPALDVLAAAGVAWLLIAIGRRQFSETIGFVAAGTFLLWSDPSLERLSGVYVRGQCETFIALFVTLSLALVAFANGRPRSLVLAGASFGMACWLKYNAIAYMLPLMAATWAWMPPSRKQSWLKDFQAWGLGLGLVSAAFLAWMWAGGALHDLRLATIDYNLHYAEEPYAGQSANVISYALSMPLLRAKTTMLWFLGGLGLLLALGLRRERGTVVVLAWVVAAVASIVMNARNLPQYFVQAAPALALAASVGLTTAVSAPTALRMRVGVVMVCLLALMRVGVEKPIVPGIKFAGLPQMIDNVRWDLAYARGQLDRTTYLQHFTGDQKYDALEVDELARQTAADTRPTDPIYVFGFSGASVCWKSGRVSASRFAWSNPVRIEFAAGEPGYGSAGLLADLETRPPVIVALQNEAQWRSRDFFMSQPSLRAWLERGYVLERETPMFSVWRRRS